MEATMNAAEPKFFRTVIVRPGQLRSPLFSAHWDKIGPRLKRGMEQIRAAIDSGAGHCTVCEQQLLKHDNNTVFVVQLGYDENNK
jgi:hypothetical protein